MSVFAADAYVDQAISELLRAPQFQMTFAEKQRRLLPLLQAQVRACCRLVPAYDRYVAQVFPSAACNSYEDVPYLPVSVFKQFDLTTVDAARIERVVRSSGTSGRASSVGLDRATSFRQTRALSTTLSGVIGPEKRPYLVLDAANAIAARPDLVARGAALRGFLPFATSVTCAFTDDDCTEMNVEGLEEFFARHAGQEILVAGFTFVIWSQFVSALHSRGIRFQHPRMTVLHGGGWKRMTELRVDRRTFNDGVAAVLGCDPGAVRDFYGMAEQGGLLFVDCTVGNKHSPNTGEVVIRDTAMRGSVKPGEDGLIEVFNVTATSYPGHAMVTEDLGTLGGYDDCPCGQSGAYFSFRSRVAHAEPRGCGDTSKTTRVVAPSEPPARGTAVPADAGEPRIFVPGDERVAATAFGEWRREMLASAGSTRVPTGAVVGLLDAAGAGLATPEVGGGIEGIAFLSSWLRRTSLARILQINMGDRAAALDRTIDAAGVSLRAMPRGVVCHWAAGNVPTLAIFSWALATLAGNASIVRVPESSVSVTRRIFAAIADAVVESDGRRWTGHELLRRTRVVTFESERVDLGHAMSLVADARVVWGGSAAVAAIAGFPRAEHCEDLVFGPKLSIALIDAGTLADADASRQAFAAIARDAVMFDQAACSSPQVVFVEMPRSSLAAAGALAAEALAAAARRAGDVTVDAFAATRIMTARAAFGLGEGTGVLASPGDLTWTVLVGGEGIPDPIQSRTLFVTAAEDLFDVLPMLSPKVQTIGVAIADDARRAAFCEAAAMRGVARHVRPGTMNSYDSPWDGMMPIERLVRWSRL